LKNGKTITGEKEKSKNKEKRPGDLGEARGKNKEGKGRLLRIEVRIVLEN